MSEPSALEALLSGFQTNAGTMPAINPPEAPAVMAAQTAPEVAGEPEPEAPPEPPPAPTAKPTEVVRAEAKPRTRRTAAVVQKELDDANARIFQLEALAAKGGAPDQSGRVAELEAEVASLRAVQGELSKGAVPENMGVVELCDALIALGFRPRLVRE